MRFALRFPERLIRRYASRFDPAVDAELETRIAPAVRRRGHLRRDEFLALCRWKTPRSAPSCASNPADFIEEVTRVSLSTGHERLRIEVLMLLAGVSWPTASVILHFCAPAPYPVLDYRALWSLSIDRPPHYAWGFWEQYTASTRKLAKRARVSMRELDRALWQYAKENQP